MDTTCDTCKVPHFIPNMFTTCLSCRMKQKKAADIKKLKTEAIAAYNEKVEGVNF